MRFANPAGLLLGLLALPIVILHMLRPRRPPVEVSSTFLWREMSRPVSAAAPWQRLRPSTLLILQLLVVALLATAAAGPVRTTPAPLAPHTVFILDASASMAAAEGRPEDLRKPRRRPSPCAGSFPPAGWPAWSSPPANPGSCCRRVETVVHSTRRWLRSRWGAALPTLPERSLWPRASRRPRPRPDSCLYRTAG